MCIRNMRKQSEIRWKLYRTRDSDVMTVKLIKHKGIYPSCWQWRMQFLLTSTRCLLFARSIGCRLCSTVGLLPREISGSSPLISQYDTTRNANYLTCAQNYTSSSCSQNYKCTRRSAVTAQRAACETWTAHPSYWGRCLKAQTLWERGHPLLKCWYCSIGVDGATAILEKLGVTHDLGW